MTKLVTNRPSSTQIARAEMMKVVTKLPLWGMVLIGYEMNKNVYEKTEVVFKMTLVRKKKKKKKKKKTFGYETIGNHSENK